MRSPSAFFAGLSVRAKLGALAGVMVLGQLSLTSLQYVTFQRFRIGGEAYADLKAQADSIDALTMALADVHRLNAMLRSLGEQPAVDEVRLARARVVEADGRIAEALEQVRRLRAAAGDGDPVREAAAAWNAERASLLEQLSPGAAFDRRGFAAFLDGPQQKQHARMVEGLEGALGSVRLRKLRLEQEVAMGVRRAVTLRIGLAMVLTVAMAALFLLIGRSILQPLSSLVRLAEQVGQGDLSVELPPVSGDELGRAAESLGQMVRALRSMVGALAGSAADVGDAAARMRAVATEQLAGAERQAAAVRQTQDTAEEIRQSSRVASERAEQLRRAADTASAVGHAGATSLAASRGGIESIKAGIDEIGERIGSLGARALSLGRVARTIKDITDQMNMLALNAAMEAMRAGAHGKMFAVVAREMRSLTNRAAESTEEIVRELAGTGEALRQAVAATDRGREGMTVGLSEIEASARTLQRLSEMVSQSSGGMDEIALAVAQQDQGIGQVFGALTELTATLEQSESNVARIRESIQVLESAAARVRDATGAFRV